MTVLGGIGFTAPWLLLALLALPILWLLLRAVPPSPTLRRFPGVALLLGLRDDEQTSDRTPWWLLLLRLLAVSAIIVGLAGPVLNPAANNTDGKGPLLIVLDGSWAAATQWARQEEAIKAELGKASGDGRLVAILSLTDPQEPTYQTGDQWRRKLASFQPAAWQPTAQDIEKAITITNQMSDFETAWFSDNIEYENRAKMLTALQKHGTVQVFQTGANTLALAPSAYRDGIIELTAHRAAAGPAQEITLQAEGRDPTGNNQILATVTAVFETGATTTTAELSLPAELRARLSSFSIAGQRSAGAHTIVDDSLRRREVALIGQKNQDESLQLLSPLHYIRQALEPTADLIDGGLADVMPANPDVIVLADVAKLSDEETAQLTEWIDAGGMLVRFAGPKIAGSDISRIDEDPLMPVRLRAGGRSVGGAMSWGEPKALAPFEESSPFFGLKIPNDVTVTSQVVAQPDVNLAERTIALLSDGTPLVTRKTIGQGQIILFHVTATAEWSTLPLSVLFVDMLERLAISSAAAAPDIETMEGTVWTPQKVMDGFGTLSDAGTLPGVDGVDLVSAPPGPMLQPGIYISGDRSIARNVFAADSSLIPAQWPADVPVQGLGVQTEQPIGGWLLAFSLILLLLDIIATLALSGKLVAKGRIAAGVILALLFAVPFDPAQAQTTSASQADAFAVEAATEVTLAHVITGNKKVDDVAHAGLTGLSDILFFRTSVEPAPPTAVNLETDELALFPLLYWPITPDQPQPSKEAYAKLNTFLRAGGMILFDTRDADIARFGGASPNGRKLQQLAAPLDIPQLEPVPTDHVLTRTFYLLQDFPGRYPGRDVWVEAAPSDAEQIEGMPFRNLNDGVSPVLIGGNDWAAAWAVRSDGGPMLPVGRGFTGERQRELAYRFGVNLVMYVLTGNYKSDQVHVPALLDRLGQ